MSDTNTGDHATHSAAGQQQQDKKSEGPAGASSGQLANGKTKKTYYLAPDTVQRLKDAAKATANRTDIGDGVSAMADEAINFYVDHLEREYNNGKAFPVYHGRSKRGPQG